MASSGNKSESKRIPDVTIDFEGNIVTQFEEPLAALDEFADDQASTSTGQEPKEGSMKEENEKEVNAKEEIQEQVDTNVKSQKK